MQETDHSKGEQSGKGDFGQNRSFLDEIKTLLIIMEAFKPECLIESIRKKNNAHTDIFKRTITTLFSHFLSFFFSKSNTKKNF